MSPLLPKSCARRFTTRPGCYCQFCGKTGTRKEFYKLRDGPVDWWFCGDEHALEWLEWRHTSIAVNHFLHLTPSKRERELSGRTTEEHLKFLKDSKK